MAGNVKQKMAAIFFALVLVLTPAFFAVLPVPVAAQAAPAGGDAPAAGGGGDQAPVEPTGIGDIDANESNTSFFTDPIGALQTAGRSIVNLFLLSIAGILLQIISFIGYLFSLAIEILKWALTYRGYATQSEVGVGWSIVRDIINSFFIVVLIAIAISTIIRFQPYNFRSTLPRLIVAALLVNLSRTICLLAISFADSVMRTFGTQLIDILPVYVLGLRLPAITALGSESIGGVFGSINSTNLTKEPLDIVTILVSIIIAIIMMTFALGGLIMFCVILVFRILVLWFLMILSPLAFFLWGAPGRAASYWGQWLEEFIKHVIVGPVGAFFLYIIALFYVNNLQSSYGFSPSQSLPPSVSTVAADPQIFVGYLISLGMMFIALEIIEQMGVRGGQLARQIGVDGIAKGGYAKTIASRVGSVASYANDMLYGSKTFGFLSYRGTGLNALVEGAKKRREEAVERGKAFQLEAAVKAEEAGAGFRALRLAASAGNAEFFKKHSAFDLLRRTVNAPTSFARSVGDRLGLVDNADKKAAQLDRINNVDAVTKFWASYADKPQLQAVLAESRLKDIASYDSGADRARIQTLRAQVENVDADIQVAQNLGDYGRVAELEQQKAATAEELRQAEAETKLREEAKVAYGKAGIPQDSDMTAAQYQAEVAAGAQARAQQRKELQGELLKISQNVSTARGGLQGTVTRALKKNIDEDYEKDVRYAKEDLIARFESASEPADKFKRGAVLLKAAEQGLFDDVVIDIMKSKGHENFVMNQAGIKQFTEEVLQKESKMSDQESLQVLVEIEGRNRSDNKHAQTALVKRIIGGRMAHMSQTDHEKAVKNSLEKKDVLSILQKSRPDGLGYKVADKWQFHPAVLKALQDKKANLEETIRNRNQRTTIDETTLKMLKEAAGELKLNTDVKQILDDATK